MVAEALQDFLEALRVEKGPAAFAVALAGVGNRKKGAVAVQERVNDAHWSLAMALAWITYRTEQAVIDIKGDTGGGAHQGRNQRSAVCPAIGQTDCSWYV
jgi:hypothetical protein